jgi:hypothetical protein
MEVCGYKNPRTSSAEFTAEVAMAVVSYPFPARNPAYPDLHQIIFTDGIPTNNHVYGAMYSRAQGDGAKTWRFQYLGIEEELERAFRFVSPCDDNAAVFSLKFAEIIRSAANAYEILAKELYAKFYNDADQLNIFNYLALDVHLNVVGQNVTQLLALGQFPNHPEVERPFANLAAWNRQSVVSQNQKPIWWDAYNAIKHSNAGLRNHATLANAMAAAAGLFLMIERVYGFGVLQGGLFNVYTAALNQTIIRDHPRWARLFIRI